MANIKIRLKALMYCTIYTALSGYLLYTSTIDLFNSVRIMFDGARVEGKVNLTNRVIRHNRQDGYYVLVEFADNEGNAHQIRNSHLYSFLFVPEMGEVVFVRYLRSNPQVAMLATIWESFIGPVISLLVGAFVAFLVKTEFSSLFNHQLKE